MSFEATYADVKEQTLSYLKVGFGGKSAREVAPA
jgi:hypothetical protein